MVHKLDTFIEEATFPRINIAGEKIKLSDDRHAYLLRAWLLDPIFTYDMLVDINLLLSSLPRLWKGPYPLYVLWLSKTPDVYSLGGYLKRFLSCITCHDDKGRKVLRAYAEQCIESVFRNATVVKRAPIITVSYMEGCALGGGLEAALSSNLTIASNGGIQVALPEILFGMFPGMGGRLLPFLKTRGQAGAALARHMIEMGGRVTADEMLTVGLFDQIIPIEQLLEWINNPDQETQKQRLRDARSSPIPANLSMRDLKKESAGWLRTAYDLSRENQRRMSRYAIGQQRVLNKATRSS